MANYICMYVYKCRVIHFVISKVSVNKTRVKYSFMIFLFYWNVLNVDIMDKTLFCSKNCRSPSVVQAPIPRIYDVVNGQLASVVAWAGLLMDIGVVLNAKYAIMCRKTVLTPEDEEESTRLGLHQHFHLQERYFQGNKRNDDAQAFQYL